MAFLDLESQIGEYNCGSLSKNGNWQRRRKTEERKMPLDETQLIKLNGKIQVREQAPKRSLN